MRFTATLLHAALLSCLYFLGAGELHAECADPSRDLIVWMNHKAVQLPSIDRLYDAGGLAWNPENLQVELRDLGVEQVGQAYPNLFNSDSVAVREDGVAVPLDRYRDAFRLRFAQGTNLDSAIIAIGGLPDVYRVEKVTTVEYIGVYTNDPYFRDGSQWQLYNFGQAGPGTAGHDIKATTAWNLSKGSPSVLIAMIDGGVVVEPSPGDVIQDLVGRLAPGSDPGWNSQDLQGAGHGFQVAGVIAAAPNNNIGTTGIAWDSPLLSLNMSLDPCKDQSVVINNLRRAGYAGAKVINNSYDIVCQGVPTNSEAIGEAIAEQYKLGRVIVAGTGSTGSSQVQYPAGYGNTDGYRLNMGSGWGVIAVGSVGNTDQRSDFSNWGNHVDVVAPGEGVYTVDAYPPHILAVSGTSFTTPMVSSLAALMLAKDPTLTNDDIERIIRYSAEVSLRIAREALVVVRSSLMDPLRFGYDNVFELHKDAEHQLNIAGPQYHVYVYALDDDFHAARLSHQSLDAD